MLNAINQKISPYTDNIPGVGFLQNLLQNVGQNQQQGRLPLPTAHQPSQEDLAHNQRIDTRNLNMNLMKQGRSQGIMYDPGNPDSQPDQGMLEKIMGIQTNQPTTPTAPVATTPQPEVLGASVFNMQPIPTPNPTTTFQDLLLVAAERARQDGFHPSPVASQMAAESQRGQSNFAKNKNNYFGLGAFDHNLDNTWKFEKPEDSIDAVLNLYKTDPRYSKAYEVRHDPMQFIQAVKDAGYATDPNYVNTISNTPEWRQFMDM